MLTARPVEYGTARTPRVHRKGCSPKTTPPASGTRSVLLVHQAADAYGSDQACLELGLALRDAGFEVQLLLPQHGWLTERLSANGLDYTCLPGAWVLRRADLRWRRITRTCIAWIRGYIELRVFARARRFDLVYCNCAVTLAGPYLARAWKAPLVWHIHEMLPAGPPGMALERLLTRATALLTCSRAVGEQFHRRDLRGRYQVAYTGARVTTKAETRKPFASTPIQLVCVGRLSAWKGQEILIRAAYLLRQRGLPIHLQLIGDTFRGDVGLVDRLLSSIADLDLEGVVRLLGFRADANALVAQADVAIFPSERPEPFGMALVEAMCLARPVIATNMGGHAEIVQHGVSGLLVPPSSPDAIAAAVELLFSDQELARTMGEAARERASRFAPEGMTSVAVDTVRSLLPDTRSKMADAHRGAS